MLFLSPLLQSFELFKHYRNCQVEQEVRTNYHTTYEEESGDENVVAILNQLHDVRPTFQRCALKDC